MVDTNNERPILPFAAALQQVGRGAALNRLSRLLNELVQAVDATGKKSRLNIAIDVARYKKSDRALDVTVTSSLKAPEGDDNSTSGVFFADEFGNLSRDDPMQPQLPLRPVAIAREETA